MSILEAHDKAAIKVWDIFCESWGKIKGVKGPLMAVFVVLIIMTIAIFLLLHSVYQGLYRGADAGNLYVRYFWVSLFTPVLQAFVTAPFYAGCIMVPILRIRSEPLDVGSGYRYFHRYLATALTMLIISFVANALYLIITLPPIFVHWQQHAKISGLMMVVEFIFNFLVSIFFVFAIPLVVDKNYRFTAALKASIRCALANYFTILSLFLLLFVSYTLAPLLISAALYFVFFEITHIASMSAYMLFVIPFFIFIFIWGMSHYFLVLANLYQRFFGNSKH